MLALNKVACRSVLKSDNLACLVWSVKLEGATLLFRWRFCFQTDYVFLKNLHFK